ncbi:MAG: hypothetical protein Q8R70_10720 [Methanoregula sp.]|nr:hypothetical protein [Methanoregula sp.]
MKVPGLSAIILLCSLLFLCGCVQVIINPPGTPGVVAPVVTKIPVLPVADDTPVPASATMPKVASAAPAQDSRFIVPVGDTSRVGHRTFTFNYASEFGGPTEYTFRVPVNMSVYYGARQMKINLPANSQNPEQIQEYISSFESDPSMNELYDSVLKQLRNARYRDGGYLSDDEYLELIVAFVQQIPLVENPSPYRKYPVGVIYEKAGDSDEKSLLLVNLLAREGYDVSLMVFEEEQYETTGIRVIAEVPDSSLKVFSNGKKDYIFVDAANEAFIGAVPRSPTDFMTVDDPVIYPVGNGTKSYGPVNYVWKVVADLHHLVELKKIDKYTVINRWDKTGTCSWIKNKKLLQNTTCYCCDM